MDDELNALRTFFDAVLRCYSGDTAGVDLFDYDEFLEVGMRTGLLVTQPDARAVDSPRAWSSDEIWAPSGLAKPPSGAV